MITEKTQLKGVFFRQSFRPFPSFLIQPSATTSGISRENTPRSGFSGATGSSLPVCLCRTGGQAASGAHTESAFIKSVSCRDVSIAQLESYAPQPNVVT